MIDYLISANDEAQAQSLFPQFGASDQEGVFRWNASYAFPVEAYRPGAGPMVTRTRMDGTTYEEASDEVLPGFWLWVSLPAYAAPREPGDTTPLPPDAAVRPDLKAHPACVLVADRDANDGAGLILHTKLSTEQLTASHIRPVIAGSEYPFGAPPL